MSSAHGRWDALRERLRSLARAHRCEAARMTDDESDAQLADVDARESTTLVLRERDLDDAQRPRDGCLDATLGATRHLILEAAVVDNFARAETHRMMADVQRDAAGINRFAHNRAPAPVDKQP